MITAWFAPRWTGTFTRAWWRPVRLRLFVLGSIGFWLALFWLWAAFKVFQAAAWLAVVAAIWATQVAVLPLVAAQMWWSAR